MHSLNHLTIDYNDKKKQIKERLKSFQNLYKKEASEIFPELCFCLLTPQSNARYCDRAIQELKKSGLLFKGKAAAISTILKGKTRFHNKKAQYIVSAREHFNLFMIPGVRNSKNGDAVEIREKLVKNIKGMGYKEASHFLRNIGLGRDIAILDRHILKNLKICGVIDSIPSSLTARLYLDIEKRARQFARRVRIPLEELDLLFWSKETGGIFK